MPNREVGEILHCVGVRYRVNGSGSLRTTLRSYDNVESSSLANVTMAASTNREPTILANFRQQAMQLELKTTAIDETFKISKIVVFIRPIATGYPI